MMSLIQKSEYVFLIALWAILGIFGITPAGLAQGNGWTMKADMPTARFGLTTSVVDGKIYAIGGATAPEISVSSVEEYDPATDTWTMKTDMLTSRKALASSAVNGKLYAIGGNSVRAFETCISTVEEYNSGTTDIEVTFGEQINPIGFILDQNFLNPFGTKTTIGLSIKKQCNVILNIYYGQGQRVRTLTRGEYLPGIYEIDFTGNELPSGIYFCHLQAGAFTDAKRIVLIK